MTGLIAKLAAFGERLRSSAGGAELWLRIITGGALMPHGAQKLFGLFGGYGLEGTAGWLESIGFAPGLLFALAIGLLELVGGLMLALGLFTRLVALAVTLFMATAIFIHWGNGYFWNAAGGGFEMPLLWGSIALYFLVNGGGRRSLDARLTDRN